MVEVPKSDLLVDELKTRTPAYAIFDSNTDDLLHVLDFMARGSQNFVDELKSRLEPQAARFCDEIARLGKSGKTATEESTPKEQIEAKAVDGTTQRRREVIQQLSNNVVEPIKQFTGGLKMIHRWIPVILVTTVEAYLKDVRIFEAKVNPAIMESSKQSVAYTEVVTSQSIDDLAEQMRSRWARNFVDDGGPTRWIDKLTRMGARSYDAETAKKMETLWGIRHLIVHSAGIATPDFVRLHPEMGATVGKKIVISLDQVSEWIKLVYHFVDVTDFYFAQRYKSQLS